MRGATRARAGRTPARLLGATLLVIAALTGSADARAGPSTDRPPGASAARLSAELDRTLASLPRGERLTVIVTMRPQRAPGRRSALSRSRRVRRAVARLHREAARTQRAIRRQLANGVAQGGVRRFESLWIFNGLIIRADESTIRELAARPDVAAVDENARLAAPAAEPGSSAPEPNIGLTRAPVLWEQGITGEGVVVASLDTGVDVAHPDLSARWRGGTNSWFDPSGEHPTTPVDVSGHGTSTMGVIVGGDAGGTAIGVAPGAKWIAAKIFNDRGVATSAGIHQAFQWVLDPDGDPATADAPNVLNNSWLLGAPGCDLSFELDLENLRAAGILPVFAAGNSGPGASTSVSPANNPAAFAVGAIDNEGAIAPSSSRGPSACGEPSTTSPELVAPGVGIRSSDLFGGWHTDSGTSLAAPHVAGALALLAEVQPGLSANRQTAALEGGVVDLGEPGADNDFGWGALDVSGSYEWLAAPPDFELSASPAWARAWPGGSAEYTVSADALHGFDHDVSLSLSGLDISEASWGFSPATIAGGDGSSQLVVSPAPTIAPGRYRLGISGTDGELIRGAEVILRVPAPRDFSLSVAPRDASVARGESASFQVTVIGLGPFPGRVRLSASGVPPLARATFSPRRLRAGESSTLTVRTRRRTPTGSYVVEITGTTPGVAHRQEVTLTVR